MSARPLWQTIDLDQHAVIEASAGTGKTYTIERLVARLLCERPDLGIEQILLVTYTDKAAGELKDRIRAFLEEVIRANRLAPDLPELEPTVRARLQEAVDTFDAARISTIHGFCQRVLQEYAFENSQLFELELSGADAVLQSLFHEQVRRVWQSDYLPSLPEDARSRLVCDERLREADILTLARDMRAGDVLVPEPVDSGEVAVALQRQLAVVRRILGAVSGGAAECVSAYKALKFSKSNEFAGMRSTNGVEMLAGLAELVAWAEGPAVSPNELLERTLAWRKKTLAYSRCSKDEGWKGFRVFVPPLYRQPDGSATCDAACAGLMALIELLDRELEPLLRPLATVHDNPEIPILQQSVITLQREAEAYKRLHGIITFDDMLTRVREALHAEPGGAVLRQALRAGCRYALVDEFQDTDPVQWDIFRTLFVDGDTAHRLILVGDPKQAIYGFRGADVYTYLDAVELLGGRGRVYKLEQNFRSTPELIAALNRVFASGAWFASPEAGADRASRRRIAYTAVAAPETNPRVRLHADRSERSALNLVHLDSETPLATGEALARYAAFVAREIARLLAAPRLVFRDPEGSATTVRPLNAGDICVLVQKRRVARVLERFLRQEGVPYSFYKKQGLYQSEEAAHLSCLLDALAHPESEEALKKALLTRFFSVPLEELGSHALRGEAQLAAILERWDVFAARRQWSRLFEAIALDTGVEVRELDEPDGERRITNFRHLFDDLQLAAAAQSLDLIGLCECLEQRRAKAVEVADESSLHRLESDEPTVQLMTMHTSKGLQFPVVFIADGFSAPTTGRGNVVTYHDALGRRVFDLAPKAGEGQARAEAEDIEEQKRLYYVALTRAQFKLYLPVGWQASRPPRFCPVNDLLTRSLAPLWASGSGPGFRNDVLLCHLDVAGHVLGHGQAVCPVQPLPGDCVPHSGDRSLWLEGDGAVPLLPDLRSCRRHVDSFTSLSRHSFSAPGGSLSVPFVLDGSVAAEDEADVESPGGDTLTLLPRGAITGDVLHHVLETLCTAESPGFETVRAVSTAEALLAEEPGVETVLRDAMLRFGLANQVGVDGGSGVRTSTLEQLALLVWRALCTPILQDGVCIGDVPRSRRRAEMAFFLSQSEAILGADELIPATRRGLFTGFIDLLFEHRGRYYIADWKSNTLDDYGPQALAVAMEQADYLLQYRIYVLAVLEWLRQSVPGFTPEQFGGVFYLFVRGMTGGNRGIYMEPWDCARSDDYRQAVRRRLQQPVPRRREEEGVHDQHLL